MLIESSLIYLALIALGSSTVAGIFGFGGGMLLIAALPNFLPANALIPVHSAVQLLSNTSRAALSWKDIHWGYVSQHFLGSLVGISIAYLALRNLSLTLIPLFIGFYILLNVWSPFFQALVGRIESFYLIGAIQTGISLLVGAPGPLPMPLLLRRLDTHHQMVCTLAMFMTFGHILKIIIFIFMGFAFKDYLLPATIMGIAAIVGSYIGTLLRKKIDLKRFTWIVKILLTMLALLAIIKVLNNLL